MTETVETTDTIDVETFRAYVAGLVADHEAADDARIAAQSAACERQYELAEQASAEALSQSETAVGDYYP